MVSALTWKSFGDLKKRKARTVFTVLTIALAVSALGMFAVMPLIDEAMAKDVKQSNLYNLQVTVNDLTLNDTQLAGLAKVDNVRSVETKSVFYTRMYIGERRNDAILVGVRDFAHQNVDIVGLDSGSAPKPGEILTDESNDRYAVYSDGTGDIARIYDGSGQVRQMKISGVAHCLQYSGYASEGVVVLYAELATVNAISNTTGINVIEFTLDRTGSTDIEKTVSDVQAYLAGNTAFTAFTDMPSTRVDGDYPGKEAGDSFAQFFYVLVFMTLFCSLFLISNTMHTMITEQKKEIAQMKAIGATRLQVLRSYLTTAFIMGTAGSVAGAIGGVFISYAMAAYIGSYMYGISPAFSFYLPIVFLSLAVGITLTMLATLPALLMALRTTTREGLQNEGLSVSYGNSVFDRMFMKMGFVPRTTQMGLRNVTRKKGRSISTMLQVALAVGMFLGIVAFGYSLTEVVSKEWGNFTCDIMVSGQTEGGKPLTENLSHTLEGIDGIKSVEPIVLTQVTIDGNDATCFAYEHNTTGFDTRGTVVEGRWYTGAEQESNASVVVLSKTLSEMAGLGVGDDLEIKMATGTYTFRIIGISSSQMMNGMNCNIPINTVQDKLLMGDKVTGFVVMCDSKDHGLIDRSATAIEDTMLSNGYVTNNMIIYVSTKQNQQDNQQIINAMIAVGTLIILVTMIGLMSTLTMNVIERTKEIGMLRCIGSSSWSVRSIFATEGVVLAVAGWLIGIPLGFGVGTLINYMVDRLLHVQLDFLYPVQFVVIALVITVLTTLIVIQPPLFRASRLRPGDALRYE